MSENNNLPDGFRVTTAAEQFEGLMRSFDSFLLTVVAGIVLRSLPEKRRMELFDDVVEAWEHDAKMRMTERTNSAAAVLEQHPEIREKYGDVETARLMNYRALSEAKKSVGERRKNLEDKRGK